MMKAYNLTDEQLNFIISIGLQSKSSPINKERFESLRATLPQRDQKREKDGVAVRNEKIQNHSPQAMVRFLSLFSRDDNFKWYTHKWDQEGVTLENLVSKQKEGRDQLLSMVHTPGAAVNYKTYAQVWNFINFNPDSTKKYTWRDNQGKSYLIGWHSVKALYPQHADYTIDNELLPDGHQFKDYIRLFKTSIEFRLDLGIEGRFSRFIRTTINRFINGALNVSYGEGVRKIGKDINIYCDVVGVLEGLNIICDWIVKYKVNGSNVIIDLKAEEDGYELSILHEGSYFSNLKKLTTPSGDMERLRKRLFSVCDITIKGDYQEDGVPRNPVAVYVLEDKTKLIDRRFNPCRIEQIGREVGGIEYLLKFYKG